MDLTTTATALTITDGSDTILDVAFLQILGFAALGNRMLVIYFGNFEYKLKYDDVDLYNDAGKPSFATFYVALRTLWIAKM
jgi:hypothetical protein